MLKKDPEPEPSATEPISDEEIDRTIRYLDPQPTRTAEDALAVIAVLVIVFSLCAILIAFRLEGL